MSASILAGILRLDGIELIGKSKQTVASDPAFRKKVLAAATKSLMSDDFHKVFCRGKYEKTFDLESLPDDNLADAYAYLPVDSFKKLSAVKYQSFDLCRLDTAPLLKDLESAREYSAFTNRFLSSDDSMEKLKILSTERDRAAPAPSAAAGGAGAACSADAGVSVTADDIVIPR